MTNLTDDPAAWRASRALIADNRITFDTWRNLLDDPPPVPTVKSEPEGIFVTLADLDDLVWWFEAAGGVVERGPEFAGTRTWVLRIATGPECRNLMVQVSVVALADAQPMHTLLDAARLAVPLPEMTMAVSA